MIKSRKILGVFFVVVMMSFMSCTKSRDDIVLENSEEYLKERMKDKDSYEFVSFKIVDSVLYKDNIDFRRRDFERDLERSKRDLERQEGYKLRKSSLYSKDSEERAAREIEKYSRILLGILELEENLGGRVNEVASYTYVFSFRGNNSFGAKVLNEYIVQTDDSEELKIINMVKDIDKMFLSPNDFPGYRSMVKSIWEEYNAI